MEQSLRVGVSAVIVRDGAILLSEACWLEIPDQGQTGVQWVQVEVVPSMPFWQS